MKLLVVDHVGNPGGGSRVVRALLPAISRVRKDIEIEFLGDPTAIQREQLSDTLGKANISVDALRSLRFQNRNLFGLPSSGEMLRFLRRSHGRFFSRLLTALFGDVRKEVERRAEGFDVVLFPWPYFLEPPEIKIPLVGIFHDFNFRYFFGGVTIHPEDQLLLDAQIQRWLDRTWPVVSTHFMAGELKRFFPMHRYAPTVVHLAPPGGEERMSRERAKRIISSLRIPSRYFLYPCNTGGHKNVANAIAAVAILREQGHDVTLILTGPGLGAHVSGRATRIGVEREAARPDVIGLGYVTNDQIDALITCATAVLSCSTYEAGNGPGLDAWVRETPVAMSNIPAFLEHVSVQGVIAQVFDPRNPVDIAAKLKWILENPARAAEDARASAASLMTHTWERTAQGYSSVFDGALRNFERP